ncbi:MAG: helix-turn-helix transcriptional regulator [Candidatus Thiodiazotropha sp. (ex Epidulcina cf. delphinae)]|nr:helix-turn-helix transcriptional regulator [Candidatus Thiodiazotropha sp. (ex Epidulcina cf. delphinae)]
MFYPESKDFSNAEKRAFAREELVYNVTEDILVVLDDLGISKKELARRLGKSRSYVTQVLSGSRNMTLGSLSDICFAIGVKPKVVYVTVETKFDNIGDSRNYHWKNECSAVMNDDLIRRTENILDRRGREKWVTQQAA